jgi:hypothetical protein
LEDEVNTPVRSPKVVGGIIYLGVALMLAAIFAAAKIALPFQFILIVTILTYVFGLALCSVALWLVQNDAVRLALWGVGVACLAFAAMIAARAYSLEVVFIGGVLALILLYFGVLHVQRTRGAQSNHGEARDS